MKDRLQTIMLPPERNLARRARTGATRARLGLLRRLRRTVTVSDAGASYAFVCETLEEYLRAVSLTWKEPGTYRWLREEIHAGDVVYDVGANVGVYTVPAAVAVGDTGSVVAFEPHVANARSLLRNVEANRVVDRVSVLSCALHHEEGFFDFKYAELPGGTAMSQLAADRDALGRPLRPVATELKYATTVDRLLERGAIRPPTLVKIDVDGNELQILRGMRGLLTGGRPPRAIQVEVNVEERDELLPFMEDVGYTVADRHYTAGIQWLLDRGENPDDLPYNAIFSPTST